MTVSSPTFTVCVPKSLVTRRRGTQSPILIKHVVALLYRALERSSKLHWIPDIYASISVVTLRYNYAAPLLPWTSVSNRLLSEILDKTR